MIKISKFISKDFVIGGIAGGILATIITSIIDSKAIESADELHNEALKKMAEDLMKLDDLAEKALEDQDDVIETQNARIKELEDELAEYKAK